MTKTTNFEISKKLKEAGFEAETEYYWHTINNKIELHHVARAGLGDVKSYDLETILDALPAFIDHNNITYDLWVWNKGIGYYPNYDKYSGEGVYNMENSHIGYFLVDKSLADTAGKMWLMLKEKGLI